MAGPSQQRAAKRCMSTMGLPLDRAGNAAVEFALLAPLVLAFLTAAVDLGFAFNERKRLELAADTALSYARRAPDATAAIQAAALNATGMDPQSLTVDVATFCSCLDGTAVACADTCSGEPRPGTYVQVTVTSTFNGVFGLIPVVAALDLSADAVGRVR